MKRNNKDQSIQITRLNEETPVETGVKPKLTAYGKDFCGNKKKCNLFMQLKAFCQLVDKNAKNQVR